jgi:hypothetical protein
MISPASGIRRPSYNGAPAMQSFVGLPRRKAYEVRPFLSFDLSFNSFEWSDSKRFNVCERVCPHRSKARQLKTGDR